MVCGVWSVFWAIGQHYALLIDSLQTRALRFRTGTLVLIVIVQSYRRTLTQRRVIYLTCGGQSLGNQAHNPFVGKSEIPARCPDQDCKWDYHGLCIYHAHVAGFQCERYRVYNEFGAHHDPMYKRCWSEEPRSGGSGGVHIENVKESGHVAIYRMGTRSTWHFEPN